jgi:hypothetical protein
MAFFYRDHRSFETAPNDRCTQLVAFLQGRFQAQFLILKQLSDESLGEHLAGMTMIR